MAATLANGGVNPRDRRAGAVRGRPQAVLSVMATCGMYDGAGDWLYTVGLPAKSGVSGGILAVVPGQLGIAVFSPPLDARGNSVRGVAPAATSRATSTCTSSGAAGRAAAPSVRATPSRAWRRSATRTEAERSLARRRRLAGRGPSSSRAT